MGEREIIELLLKREDAGAEELLRQYGPLIRYIIAPILEKEEDREECLSEVVLKVWDRIGTFDVSKASFTTWLTAIARNSALNRSRRLHSNEELSEKIHATSGQPEEELLKRERKNRLFNALEGLPAVDKTLFYRKYYYMQSTAQIAREMGMSERAVEGRLYRIKQKLKKMLGGEGDE
ncbi:MAG: sigma-70 family RNA polymerase sigma factor [Firmicutes bacterium]|nr:sigma-70 family RNA polymerase sigma factor [Bacillota bacterium]